VLHTPRRPARVRTPTTTLAFRHRSLLEHPTLGLPFPTVWGPCCGMARPHIEAPDGMAWCSAHQEFHPVIDFQRDASRRNGLSGNCRSWRLARQRTYDASRQAARGVELNRKRSERRGRSGEAEKKRRRRARLSVARRVEPTRRERAWLGLVSSGAVACCYCGSPVEQIGDLLANGVVLARPLAPDHVIPVARGGDDTFANQVPACWHCNSSKAQMLIVEWKRHRRRVGATPTSGGLLAARSTRRVPLP
jgi:hypothetical protein